MYKHLRKLKFKGEYMKGYVCFLAALLMASNFAKADFYGECELVGGAEKALTKAPDYYEINEAGEIVLYKESAGKSSTFSTEDKNLVDLSQGQKIKVKSLTKEGSLTLGEFYSFNLNDCDQDKPARGMYTWRIEEMDHVQNNGFALYDCTCSED
jgi:hypothetical protein